MKYPWIDQNYFRSSASSSYSSGRNTSLSPWDSPLRFFLLTVDSRLRVGSWNLKYLPDNFAEPTATGKTNSASFWIIRTSFAFSLLGYVSDASNFPILQSQRSKYPLPKFSPRKRHVPEGFSKSSFILKFPVCQEVLVISQIATAFHRIRLPLIIRSRLQRYGWCLFFYSTYSSFCNSDCLWSMKCSCSMIPW